jgi:hypothetical protein
LLVLARAFATSVKPKPATGDSQVSKAPTNHQTIVAIKKLIAHLYKEDEWQNVS